jgi:Carbohydrate binding domain
MMKKLTIACLTVALGAGAIAAESKNLLKNGSFEQLNKKGKIVNWGASDWNPAKIRGKITLKQTDDAAVGKKAALVESTAGKGNLLIHQGFKKPVGVEKKYKVTLKFKGPIGGKVNTSFRTNESKAKKLKAQYVHSKAIKCNGKWQDLTATYTIKPVYSVVSIYVRFDKTPVQFDDVKVVEVK